LYGALARLRAAAYGRGWLRAERVGAPVISVGNLTTGGTGKTPLVAWVARALADEGRRVCVLTRGYGRANPRRRVVVSDGAQMLADALTGGDEPRWLAENLPGVAVVADADRAAAARWALSELRSDCFVLDDGFQHLRLARDGDLVTIDATNPWGGGYLLPRGRLREPVTALRRAGACVVTRADLVEDPQDLAAQVAELSGGRPVFLASTKVVGARALQGGELRPGAAVLAFCALGNPSAFFRQVAAAGYKLAARQAFRDHHRYTTGDLAQLVQAAQRAGAEALLTSAKDAVKLTDAPGPLPVFVLEIELAMDRETELRGWLREQIATKK
jgi:tetraacyldisaccharide 4'-kinase